MNLDPSLPPTPESNLLAGFSLPHGRPVNPVILLERDTRPTKILATLGPATNSEEMIRAAIEAGANAVRLNFSHPPIEAHASRLALVRRISGELGCPVAVVQDLCGPKIRTTALDHGPIDLRDGQRLSFRHGSAGCTGGEHPVIYTEAFRPEEVLVAGQRISLSDGRIRLRVEEVTGGGIEATVIRGGQLRSRAGLALPETELNLPALTPADYEHVAWGVQNGVDWIALSFVSSGQDLRDLRTFMRTIGREIPIVAKIERRAALQNLGDIIAAADAVMVARGDLGEAIPPEEVPYWQRVIITRAHERGIPAIVATQMLTSMVEHESATRGEIEGIVGAVEQGADLVMLSEETAIGHHPIACIEQMARAVRAGDALYRQGAGLRAHDRRPHCSAAEAVVRGIPETVASGQFDAVILCSDSAEGVNLLARYRPAVPIYAFTHNSHLQNRLSLYWGVTPILSPKGVYGAEERGAAVRTAAERFFLEHPDATHFTALVTKGLNRGDREAFPGFQVHVVNRTRSNSAMP